LAELSDGAVGCLYEAGAQSAYESIRFVRFPLDWVGGDEPARERPPNFVVVLADDLGYGDLGCYGHPVIQTPNLDRLAARGMRLTDAYAAAPVCSPSRCGLLTGRTPTRLGVYDWIPAQHPAHLRASEVTIATILRGRGYATAQVGKWHCNGMFNSPRQPQPGDHGFDHWMSTQNNAGPSHRDPINFVRNGTAVGKTEGFSCQIVVTEAIDWLEHQRDPQKPFFLFVCFHEPHEPIASPDELVAMYPAAKNREQAEYFANVTNMDRAVGRLIEALERLTLTESTLVWFTSDNGPETLKRYRGGERSHGSAGPLRGMKLHLYEGGIRVPGILAWPGRIRPGQTVSEPVSGVDVLPTLCELAGAAPPADRPLDGASVAPLLDGKPVARARPLFWHYFRALGGPKAAIRLGDWKLAGFWDAPDPLPGSNVENESQRRMKSARLTRFELYNLRDDVGEQRDRSADEPARLASMRATLERVYAEVLAEGPAWDVPSAPAGTPKAGSKKKKAE
jgi:arylsulfatase A